MNGWKHPGILAAIFLALGSPSMQKADAHRGLAERSSVTSHGVRLSLSVPRSTYPRNALVQVDIAVRNVSNKTVLVPTSCTGDNPAAQVLRRDGMVTYPPALPLMPGTEPSCQMLSPPVPLRPGRTITGKHYVVLRGNSLRAVVNFDLLPGVTSQSNAAVVRVTTPSVRVRLIHRPAPHIKLTGAPALHAYVTGASASNQGPLLYMDWYRCQNIQATTIGGHVATWTPDPQTPVLVPGCDEPVEWHAAAGWLGQPVAYLNYVRTDYRISRASSIFTCIGTQLSSSRGGNKTVYGG